MFSSSSDSYDPAMLERAFQRWIVAPLTNVLILDFDVRCLPEKHKEGPGAWVSQTMQALSRQFHYPITEEGLLTKRGVNFAAPYIGFLFAQERMIIVYL